MSHWQPYFIAIMIGLLIGIEREKAHPNQKAMGIRTFLLVSLLGVIAGGLQHIWLSVLLTAFTLGLILVSYFTQTNSNSAHIDRGLTTEFAAGIVFCLGYSAHQSPTLVAVIGPIVAVILFSKASLHRFTHAVKPSELQAALLLLLAGVVVINLAPDTIIDPWGIFNPRKFGYLILILATLEFSSYVVVKIIGPKNGPLIIGFLGGWVSSTAVLLSSARHSTIAQHTWRTPVTMALAANLAALVELLLIIGLISPTLLLRVAIPIGVGLLFGSIALIIVAWKRTSQKSPLIIKSPLDWRGVFRLSIILGAILAAISITKLWLGEQATLALSFLTGLFELHGVSLANATMYSEGQLNVESASMNIFLAVVASLFAKVCISWALARGIFARVLTAIFLPMIGIIALTFWLMNRPF